MHFLLDWNWYGLFPYIYLRLTPGATKSPIPVIIEVIAENGNQYIQVLRTGQTHTEGC
jgi:hypothetical protein